MNSHDGSELDEPEYGMEEDVEMYQDADENYIEEYGDEYIQLDDGTFVQSNQMDMPLEADPVQPIQRSYVVRPSTSESHFNRTPGSTIFAIRGGQMFRVDKPPGVHGQYSEVQPIKNIEISARSHIKPIYHVAEPTSSRSMGPYSTVYNTIKSEFNNSYQENKPQFAVKVKVKRKNAGGQRKPCNCTKSMCLKLYCDCFANGEFCRDCNCKDCHNNMEHEDDRTRAIKQSLERNPNAFKPKIGVAKAGPTDVERLHQKGCHCKKSGCLKNYCECYEAKVPCTDRCKCKGCQNTEHDRAIRYKDKSVLFRFSTSALMNLANAAAASDSNTRSASPVSEDESEDQVPVVHDPRTFPWFYMTDEVIEAATLCMVAQAEEALSKDNTEAAVAQMERLVLREYGRCLEQIISSASIAPS